MFMIRDDHAEQAEHLDDDLVSDAGDAEHVAGHDVDQPVDDVLGDVCGQ